MIKRGVVQKSDSYRSQLRSSASSSRAQQRGTDSNFVETWFFLLGVLCKIILRSVTLYKERKMWN